MTDDAKPEPSKRLTPHEERRVAVEAGCDPRTVRRYLSGKPCTSTVAARLKAALEKLAIGGVQ